LFKQIQEANQSLYFERKVVPVTKLSINHQQPLQQRLIMRYKMQPLAREETRG